MMIFQTLMVFTIFSIDWLGSEPLSDSEDSDIDLPEDEPEQPLVVERPEKKVCNMVLLVMCVGKSKKNSLSWSCIQKKKAEKESRDS